MVIASSCDVSDPQQVEKSVFQIVEKDGKFGFAINDSGMVDGRTCMIIH